MRKLVAFAVLALVGCSKPETMIGLRCNVVVQPISNPVIPERNEIEHYTINLKTNVVMSQDPRGIVSDECLDGPCKVTITNTTIHVVVDRDDHVTTSRAHFNSSLVIDRFTGQLHKESDARILDDNSHIYYTETGTCTKETPVYPQEHKF